MYMTDKERRIRDHAVGSFTSVYPFYNLGRQSDTEIVALQFAIGTQHRPGSRGSSSAQQNVEGMRILLAKMRAAYPMERQVLVTWNIAPMEQREDMAWFSKMRQKYSSNYNGIGAWDGNSLQFESLLAAFHFAMGRSQVAVVPLDILRSLRTVYIGQERAAGEAAVRVKESRKSEKLINSDTDLDQFIGASAASRRETVVDGRGQCFRCGVPKPRGRVCTICGYAPRSVTGR